MTIFFLLFKKSTLLHAYSSVLTILHMW
jgi:hypothetical protein